MNPQDELNSLVGLFGDGDQLVQSIEHLPGALAPEAYRRMLVHDNHMTVTMEEYYGSPVEVRVIDQVDPDGLYCRKIVLLKAGTSQVVQFGIVRFNFHYVTPEVRDEIVAGATPLGRVLINLLDNALHASPCEELVRLYATVEDACLQVAIEDRGPGIPPEEREHVFEAGYTTRRDQGGSGVGLTVAREIASTLGGTLDLDPAPERGTRATLRIPTLPDPA